MKEYIKRWLGIDEIEKHLKQVEAKLGALEDNTLMNLTKFKDYKNRTKEELTIMENVIDNLIECLDALIKKEITNDTIQKRAKPLLKRLRNHKSRIHKSKAA